MKTVIFYEIARRKAVLEEEAICFNDRSSIIYREQHINEARGPTGDGSAHHRGPTGEGGVHFMIL